MMLRTSSNHAIFAIVSLRRLGRCWRTHRFHQLHKSVLRKLVCLDWGETSLERDHCPKSRRCDARWWLATMFSRCMLLGCHLNTPSVRPDRWMSFVFFVAKLYSHFGSSSREAQVPLESLLCMFAWFSFVPPEKQNGRIDTADAHVTGCKSMRPALTMARTWPSGLVKALSWRVPSARCSTRRPLLVEQCIAESCTAVPHLSMSSRRGCSWIQRNTRVSSALARALYPPRARGLVHAGVHCTGLVQVRCNGDMYDQVRDGNEWTDAWKNRDFITLGDPAVAEFVTEVFLCTYEACSVRCASEPSHANWMLATGQKLVAENDVAYGLYSDFSPMSSKQTPYTMTQFSVQQKVAEDIHQNLGTSSSEMSKGAVLTVSLVSGIAAGVAAPAATIPHTADGLISEVNKKGAAGEGSMMVRLGQIAGARDSLFL